jgi:hypothetical protein
VQEKIAEIRRLWSSVEPALLLIADRPVDDPEARAAQALVQRSIPPLAEAVDDTLASYEKRAESVRQRFFLTLLLLSFLAVAGLAAGATSGSSGARMRACGRAPSAPARS